MQYNIETKISLSLYCSYTTWITMVIHCIIIDCNPREHNLQVSRPTVNKQLSIETNKHTNKKEVSRILYACYQFRNVSIAIFMFLFALLRNFCTFSLYFGLLDHNRMTGWTDGWLARWLLANWLTRPIWSYSVIRILITDFL